MEMNKRGQFGIYGLVIGLVLALVLISFFVWNTQFRYVVLGVALAVGGFFVLFKADINKKVKTGLFVGLLATGLLFVLMSGVLQSTIGNELPSSNLALRDFNKVYVPFYSSISCVPTTSFNQDFKISTSVNNYYCGGNLGTKTGDINYYVPGGCEYSFVEGLTPNGVQICDQTTNICDNKIYLSTGKTFDLKYGQYAKLSKYALFGESKVNVKALRYQLKIKRSDGKETLYSTCSTNNLDIDYISGKTDVSLLNKENIQPSDSIYNVITHFAEIVGSKNVINNGRTYIKDAGTTCDIVKSTDGFKFVDLDTCVANPNIKCNPSETARCECGTTSCELKEDSTGNTCTAFYREESYFTQTQYCETSCVNGQIAKVCKNKIVCPASTPILTLRNAEMVCVSDDTAKNNGTELCNKWYQIEGTQTDYKYNILFFKFGATEKPVCKVNPLVNIVAVVVVIIVLGSVALYSMKPKRRKK